MQHTLQCRQLAEQSDYLPVMRSVRWNVALTKRGVCAALETIPTCRQRLAPTWKEWSTDEHSPFSLSRSMLQA